MQLKNQNLLQSNAFINNHWMNAVSGKTFTVVNPANGQTIIEVADADVHETDDAINAAAAAFIKWRVTTAKERSVILKRWFDLIVANADDLALLLTTEQGKPITESKNELLYGASFIEWFAEECKRTYGETIPSPVSEKRFITIKQPIGVVAAITPWNFPIAMVTRKIAPAIAAGCTVVLKPAAFTPLSALALAYLGKEAGIPEGVFNVITTTNSSAVGKLLTEHQAVKKISFTGSTKTGAILMQQASSTVKKLSLELGGNAPVIVFEDADIEKAVKGAIASKYRNAGQTCVCANRIFVHRSIEKEFIEKYTDAVKTLKVGNGADSNVSVGPLINHDAVDKVKNLLKDAIDKGAEIKLGGHSHLKGALFFEPTVITNCNADMLLSREEIFGPVAAFYSFETDEEVVRYANDTLYGLAAYFFTENVNRVFKIAEALECGMIGVNEGIISYAEIPFGGVKQSGYGREGSKYGIEEYLNVKYLCLNIH